MRVFFVVVLLCTVTSALHYPRYDPKVLANKGQTAFPASWFEQILDHFDPENDGMFQQRYYVNDQYWDKNSGPVFLYINGEGPVYAPPSEADDEVVMLAQKFGALIVTLEHRYYGLSSPFTDLTTDNLQFLSSKQAIYDLANFIVNYTSALPNSDTITRKIFNIGGSYSGALSAWFRLKFPHVTCGALASSGVVNAILDFTAFDEQVAASAGPACADALRKVTQLVQGQIEAGGSARDEIKASFSASTLVDDGDFFYFLGDSMAEGVQYGFQDDLCMPLLNAGNDNQKLVQAYINYTLEVWGQNLGTPAEYATAWQQNTSVSEDRADRQWWFQTCTELAYFQNAPQSGSIRSNYVNMTYHRTHCEKVFGKPLWPDVQQTNIYYGGNHTAASKVFFANGSQDPWQRASVQSSLSPSEPELTIQCHNCGHCVDLRGCPGTCTNQTAVDQARQQIRIFVDACLKS